MAGEAEADIGQIWRGLHESLINAGLTKKRAAFQSAIGHLVEDVAAAVVGIGGESYYDWMMTGSFVEGWGNNLFRLDGVTGIDSDIDWSQVVKHKVYHLKDTCTSIVDCINRKDYTLENGHIQVKNCSQQPAFATDRHGLRPDTDECHAYPCCSYPKTVLENLRAEGVVCQRFAQILEKQFDNQSPQEDVHFVRASVPGKTNQMRLSCTRQERFIMSQLSTVQGQLFTLLKYLFKADDDVTGSAGQQPQPKKILQHLKSFHAKTLLMTLLRDQDSWPDENSDDDEESVEKAANRLEDLFHRALKVLYNSITDSLKLYDDMDKGEQVDVPRVLDHALLAESALYLKVKKKPDATNGKKKLTEPEVHYHALKEVKADLENLMDTNGQKLKSLLRNYKSRVDETVTKRGISGPDAPFLFVPLLMLPRNNLDTLLEEKAKQDEQPSRGLAADILKEAYVSVWHILNSLSSGNSTAPQGGQAQADTEKAWKWIEGRECLATTRLCLKAMQLLKAGDKDDEINKLLSGPNQPKAVRWIQLGEADNDYFKELVENNDCLWAFHYFVGPKVKMSFPYLDDVQGVWKDEPLLRKDEKDKQWVRRHLKFQEDSKNSRQPSLTVNFDGLLDSFRLWKTTSGQPETYRTFIEGCLFDPRDVKDKEVKP